MRHVLWLLLLLSFLGRAQTEEEAKFTVSGYVKDMATSIEYYEQGYKALSKIGCVRARTLCRRDCTRGSVY